MRQSDLENDKSFPWSNVAIPQLQLARGRVNPRTTPLGFVERSIHVKAYRTRARRYAL